MRRKINAERKSTRRSVQIVVVVSVGLALLLAIIDHKFLAPYDSVLGQAVLTFVAALYAAGIVWLRGLATFERPQRLLATVAPSPGAASPEALSPAATGLVGTEAAR